MQTLSKTLQNLTQADPRAYVHTRVLSEQREITKTPRYSPSERVKFKQNSKRILADLATASGSLELAGKLSRCHANLAVITCGKHIARVIPDSTCGFRLCPDCARRRAGKFMRKYVPAVLAFSVASNTQPCLLTLTQKKRSESFQSAVKSITASFKALRRSKIYETYFKGGLFSVEFTVDTAGLYHVHIHALIFRTRQLTRDDLQSLKDRWFAITGDSHVINLKWIDPRQAGGITAGVKEVIKYAVKPADLVNFTSEHFQDFVDMKRQRMFGTFGEFQKFAQTFEPEPETLLPFTEHRVGEPCDLCGNPLFDVRVKGKDLPDFLERINATPARE